MKRFLLLIALAIFVLGAKAQTIDSNVSKKDTTKWITVDVVPEFPGGFPAFIRFVNKNMQKNNYLPGKVFITFTVEKDGSLTDFVVTKSLGEAEDTEALRIMKKSPNWIPGKAGGKIVRTKYSLPIYFGDDN